MPNDPRKQVADDMMQLLTRLIAAQAQQTNGDTPIPGFLFDQIVALIKLLLEWLGIVQSMTEDEFNEAVEIAKKNAAENAK